MQGIRLVAALLVASWSPAGEVPLPNGDFEAGLSGWNLTRPAEFRHGEATVETADVRSGRQAVRIVNEPEGGKVLVGLANTEAIPLRDDCRTYSVGAWLKAHRAPREVELRVASADRNGQLLTPWQEKGWQFIRPPIEPHVGQWHRFEAEFVAQDEWGGVFLTLWVNGAGADVLVDDITLETLSPDRWEVARVGARLPDPAPGIALWWEGPLRKVYPTEAPPEPSPEPIRLYAAGGECECVQLCVRPERQLAEATVTFAEARGPGQLPASAWRANLVGLIPVAKLTNAHGILGPTPDPLLPDPTFSLPAGETRVLWITLRVPRGTAPGDYATRLTLAAEGLQAEVPLAVHVYGFDLPERPSLRTIARIWQSHPDYEDLFLRNLQEHRCSGSSYIGGISASVQDGQVVVDTSQLAEAAERRLTPYGFEVFSVPNVFLGDWSGLYAKDGQWMGVEAFTPQFDRLFASYCRQTGDALRAQGLLGHALWQVWDEPHDEWLAKARHLAELVKAAAPDAQVYFTTQVHAELLDAVDIWCLPWPSTYSEASAARAREHGAVLWAYENELYSLDVPDSSLLLRAYPWRLRRYDVRGVEWWAISQWKSDPWTVPNQYAPQNGGGFFLYPTPDRTGPPIDSLRWESYREGVEDYDLLTLLTQEEARNGAPGTAQELVSRVALSPSEASRDPLRIAAAKRAASERIEQLRSGHRGPSGDRAP